MKYKETKIFGIPVTYPDIDRENEVYAPFGGSVDFEYWMSKNCDVCKNYGTDVDIKCFNAADLVNALFEYGKITKETYNLVTENDKLIYCKNLKTK